MTKKPAKPEPKSKAQTLSFSSKKSPPKTKPLEPGDSFEPITSTPASAMPEGVAKASAVLYEEFRTIAGDILKTRKGAGQLHKLLLRERLVVLDDLILNRLETAVADLSTPINVIVMLAEKIWNRRYGSVPLIVDEEEELSKPGTVLHRPLLPILLKP